MHHFLQVCYVGSFRRWLADIWRENIRLWVLKVLHPVYKTRNGQTHFVIVVVLLIRYLNAASSAVSFAIDHFPLDRL